MFPRVNTSAKVGSHMLFRIDPKNVLRTLSAIVSCKQASIDVMFFVRRHETGPPATFRLEMTVRFGIHERQRDDGLVTHDGVVVTIVAHDGLIEKLNVPPPRDAITNGTFAILLVVEIDEGKRFGCHDVGCVSNDIYEGKHVV